MVGAAGLVVQMSVAAALLRAGVSPLLATLVAIEAAIVSNHAWHRRWAWRDRAAAAPWPITLWRAHLGAGGTSLVAGLGVVALLAGQVDPLVAQVVAVSLCAVANFWMADRWVFRHARPVTSVVFVALVATALPARADGPSSGATASWERYVSRLQATRAAERSRGVAAWATDDDPQGTGTLAALRRDEVVVAGRVIADVDVDEATLEHWQGSVLLRDVSLAQVEERLRHPERYPQPSDVLKLQVSSRTGQGHEVYLRLTRSLLITATYDTWHRVEHERVDATRVESRSRSTRIDELEHPGTPRERRVPEAGSRGFLWRMQSWWRFTAVPEGVIVTCESVTLSRPVPLGLGLLSRPIITRIARESMTTAVRAWQTW